MREIKFRAWDKRQIEIYGTGMSYGSPEYFDDMLAFRFNHFESDNPSEIIYEQYTGMKDKNGLIEIYEGDIVSVTDVYGKKHNSIVAFNDGCFDVEGNSEPFHGRDYLKCSVVNHACVVIGNIHENPELIK